MNQRIFKVRLPTRMHQNKHKVTALNLNHYRNLHHYSNNYQKQAFYRAVYNRVKHIPKLGVISLHYDLFLQTKHKIDIMNIGSIVDKHFSDTLVKAKIIEDDNYQFIIKVSFGFGGFTHEKQHMVVTITELEKRNKDQMRILLDQNDIQSALETYVAEQGISGATGVELSIEDGDIVAEVTMDSDNPKTPTKTVKKRRGGGRPKGSKNKAKEDEPNVATDGEDSSNSNSGGSSEENQTSEQTTPENSEDSSSKNDSKGSQEASSNEGESVQTETPKEEESVSSIFDDDE